MTIEEIRKLHYKQVGKEEGREEGIEESKREIAKKLLKKGIDIDIIIETTELSLEEINNIIKDLEKSN
ncbi:hypothetical protein [Clostridium senegalense]|uniref:hypothetical protein n=1 Tax=Clostridium senegalense TaxID=1465809 RepID=UPI0018FE95CC|nr:hypothetical protein [Clostridium senegalense]